MLLAISDKYLSLVKPSKVFGLSFVKLVPDKFNLNNLLNEKKAFCLMSAKLLSCKSRINACVGIPRGISVSSLDRQNTLTSFLFPCHLQVQFDGHAIAPIMRQDNMIHWALIIMDAFT